MRIRLFAIALAAGLAGLGCNETNPPASGNAPATQARLQPTPAAPQQAAPPAAPSAAAAPAPIPPDGAQYSLYCATFTDAGHVATSTRMKNQLIARTGRKDWYVIHTDKDSTLYFGYYKSFDDAGDPTERARAQTDRAMVSALADDDGNKPFAKCMFSNIATADVDPVPAWDLKNAKGYWTVQIGAYRDNINRKKAAVDAVREARKEGVEAYYYHGPVVSGVYVGTWPREAVKQQDANAASDPDPNVKVLVLTSPLPEGTVLPGLTPNGDGTYQMSNGTRVKIVAPRIDIQDQSLKDTFKKYPYEAVNGEYVGRPIHQPDGSTKVEPYPSVLSEIPHDDADALTDTPPAPPADALPSQGAEHLDQPPQPGVPPLGRLRSIGD